MYDLEKLESLENLEDFTLEDANTLIAYAQKMTQEQASIQEEVKKAQKDIIEMKAENLILAKKASAQAVNVNQYSGEENVARMFGLIK